MRVRWQGICLWAVVLGSFASLVHAANPEDEYRKRIRVNEQIQPLGEHPFGESISLYDGALSFSQTDISLPGNGPTLQLIRRFEVYGNEPTNFPAEAVFGGWELELPHLETLTAGAQPTPDNPTGIRMWNVNASGQVQAIDGWQTDNTAGTFGNPNADLNARCSNFTAPPEVVRHLGDPALKPWDADEWWKGYHLILPGAGGQDVLANADTATKGAYPAVTKAHWRFSCLPATANGQPGEGFLGHAPDGSLYWFNYLVYRGAEGMTRPLGASDASLMPRVSPFRSYANAAVERVISLLSGSSLAHAAPTQDQITRSLGVLLVTKIQDRFGNTLNYSYDSNGNLTGITASDGRALSVTYAPGTTNIQSVTLQPASGSPRTWLYTYGAGGLSDVQLPDGSHWHYDLHALQSTILRDPVTYSTSSCTTLAVPAHLTPITGTITHPSGLVGQFTVQGMRHGRSYVPRDCIGMQEGDTTTPGSYALIPEAWYSLTTTQVVYSGAGVPTETWSYHYSPSNESWSTCTGSCPTTVWTDVVDPSGSTTRHIFSNKFDITESQLLRTEFYAGAAGSSALLRSEDSGYAPPNTANLPASAGTVLAGGVNVSQLTKYAPLNQRVITQDGQRYTWQALAFDAYAQPTDVKRYNDIAGQAPIEETTRYLNDTSAWVLGLPLSVTNVATGELETSNTYNSLDELTARARFGQVLMSYAWNGAGQLASFTDGNGHTTTLGNYYRGVPRAIGYPDGTSETLAVDDLGQITAITDQTGHTTSYGYDAIGRIAQISYPHDSRIDSAPWYPKVFSYAYVAGAERGVAAGHWRRTVTQGNATDTTWFDAELRPVLHDTGNGQEDISTATGYDWRGQTTFASYPVAGSPALSAISTGTRSVYDALGRLTQTQQDSELGPLTTSTAYLSGARRQVTDPKGNVTTTIYQVFDQPSYGAPIEVQAPTGITQTIRRDVYGNPLSITQSGSYGTESDSVTKTLIYDSYHRLCRSTEPETGSTVLAYDAANNLAWSAEGQSLAGTACSQSAVPAAARTTRTYDAMNRVLTIAPPAGTQGTVYSYDALGRVRSAVAGTASQGYAYNSLGGLTAETLQVDGYAWTLAYGYDAYGHRATVTYPAGTGTSETVNYAPDAWGRPTQAGSYVTDVAYFPNGQVESFAYGNGRSHLAQQNTRQLTSNFSDGAGGTLDLSEDVAYDADGNITTVTDLASGGLRSKRFGYDSANRLTSASAPGLYGTEAYSYDALNNLRTRLTGGQTLTYHYDASNRLASLSQGATTLDTLRYNAQGDTIAQNATTLNYDAAHRLTGIAGLASYAYDAAGRRVEKQPASGAPTYYFYNQAGQLLFQYAAGTATATDYIYLGTRLVARSEQGPSGQPGAITSAPSLSAPAQSGSGGYTVSWSAVSGATGYTLQSSVDGSGWSTRQASGATSWAASGQATGSYAYRVQACNANGCGPWSGTATTEVLLPPDEAPSLSVPASNSSGSYTVSWGSVATSSSYTLQASVNGGAWSTVQSGSATSWSASGQATGSDGYRVQACNASGCGPWSGIGTVVVTRIPATPTGLQAAITEDASDALRAQAVPARPSTAPSGGVSVMMMARPYVYTLSASWNAASGASRYELQYCKAGGACTTTTTTSTAVSGLSVVLQGGGYTVSVRACDSAGCSAWSAGVTASGP